MCDIPNVETHFYEGMEPDFIRYRNLDDDAIRGLPNERMRAFLRAHLLAGIKIRKVTKETFQLVSADEFRDKIFRLNTDLHSKAEEIDAKNKQIVILNEKVGTIENKVREECAQKETELQRRIREIEEQVNSVNKQLREKIAECDKAKADCEAGNKVSEEKIKQLEDETHKFKVKSEELEQELADARRRAINEQDEINRLKKQIADKEKELDEAKKAAPAKPAQPTPSDEDCELIISVLKEPYTYDIKPRDNG